jgi:hypothetical protein
MNDVVINDKKFSQKYLVKHNITILENNPLTSSMISLKYFYCADRVWVEEENNEVKFYKNRYRDPTGPLSSEELQEFFWIKLKSHII